MALEGKRVVVMGLGRFGGGVGVTRFLCKRGADVLVTDMGSAEDLSDSLDKIQGLVDSGQVTLRLGEHNASDFTTCDMVVVNPAVKPGNRFVRSAQAAGIAVTSEIRLLVEHLPNRLRTIGVTGSAGKSTVTAMIGHVLEKVFAEECNGSGDVTPSRQVAKTPRRERRVWVGGNIGGSLLEHVDEIGPEDWVVLELSSFMLEGLRADEATGVAGWSPHIAVVTNISENHLDWHGSMTAYVAAKQVVAKNQSAADVTYLPPGGLHEFNDLPIKKVYRVRSTYVPRQKTFNLVIPGTHNRINAHLAFSAAWFAMKESGVLLSDNFKHRALADFPGLPHRLQFVVERDGVNYYNDSKCTTPEAAMLAIDALTETPDGNGVHLILGGYDKGSDLQPLADLARDKCRAIYTIGATGDEVATAAEAASAQGAVVVRCGTLERAMAEIKQRVALGDVVLLSPACASWDQFANYEERGAHFIALVDM